MGSRKKSEGIALLSMYNDDEEDDDDEEMEDIDQEHQQRDDVELDGYQNQEEAYNEENTMQLDSSHDNLCTGQDEPTIANRATTTTLNYSSTALDGSLRPSTPQKQHFPDNSEIRRRVGKTKPTIVDYGHDEVAMSPEHEEPSSAEDALTYHDSFQQKEVAAVVQVVVPGLTISQPSEQVDSLHSVRETINSDLMDVSTVVPDEEVNLLDKFLPPSPKENCPEDLQKRIEKFLALKKVRRSYNAEVRNRKDYRNPDFLLHAVRYQDIDEIGSCFSKEVFDPRGYDRSDYYDEIELDMKRERERKEQELKKSPKVEFVSGGCQPGLVPPMKFSVSAPAMTASGPPPVPMASDLPPRDGRQSKKSKWDSMKLEPDVKNQISASSLDSLPTANVGSGYAAYLEQKKREGEGRRSSEKRFERRS